MRGAYVYTLSFEEFASVVSSSQSRKHKFEPGNFVLGVGDGDDFRMKSGIVIAVKEKVRCEGSPGCDQHITVLWSKSEANCEALSEECDCGILVLI